MKKQQDHQIIEQVLKGDIAAFSKLIALHESMLYTLSLGILKNKQDAEEVTQDAFVKAYQSLPHFKGDSSVSTWLYKIVYHTAISALRLRKQEAIDLEGAAGRVPDADHSSNPIQHLAGLDRKKALKMALMQLDDDDAFLVLLYYYKEQSIQEIGQITGLSESNIKVKLHRARRQLQQYLQTTFNQELESIRS